MNPSDRVLTWTFLGILYSMALFLLLGAMFLNRTVEGLLLPWGRIQFIAIWPVTFGLVGARHFRICRLMAAVILVLYYACILQGRSFSPFLVYELPQLDRLSGGVLLVHFLVNAICWWQILARPKRGPRL